MNHIPTPCRAEMMEKKSRFIALARPCLSEARFHQVLESVRQEFSDARHIAWAYRIRTKDGIRVRVNDAGEPKGTAGRPIFAHIEGNDLINTAIFVIRYFGGIKLGAGGLVRAYGGIAGDLIKTARIEEWIETVQFRVSLSYAHQKQLEYGLADYSAKIIEKNFGQKLDFLIEAPLADKERLLADLSFLSACPD